MILRASCLLLFLLAQAQAEPPYDSVVSKNVMIPMRDGVRLATDIYRPARNGVAVDGKFPVLMERTPYDKANVDWLAELVKDGYVVVGQDLRGRYHSEGRWRFMPDDVNDAYDTAVWLGKQPWCSCKIGTFGGSYDGARQHAMAISGAPFLAAMVPIDAAANAGYYGMRHHGAFELRFFNWIFTYGARDGSHEELQSPHTKQVLEEMSKHVTEYVKALPLRAGTTPLKLVPDYEAWLIEAMSHGDLDDYWRNYGASVIDHVAEYKDVPVYHIGGWYDSWAAQTSNLSYATLAKTKHNQRLIMGPWVHGGAEDSHAGEAEFGPDASIKYLEFAKHWYDRWLKGIANGVENGPPVRIFVMGGG